MSRACSVTARRRPWRTFTSAIPKKSPSCAASTRRSTRLRNTCSTTILLDLTLRGRSVGSDCARAEMGVAGRSGSGICRSLRSRAHSATAAEISGGRLIALWYGGSREGASDVSIYTSVYSLREKNWSPERVVVTREFAQRHLQRTVRKLGNPVVGRDSKGRLCLYFVSVSVGGWGGSAVNLVVSEDEG